MKSLTRPTQILCLVCAFVIAGFLAPASVTAQPGFSKAFAPSTIGPGSTSLLTFTINNGNEIPVTDLAFVDTLPAGMVIATPANASTTCPEATLTAPGGGSTITFTGDRLGAIASCTIRVQVTSSVVGTHMNVSGDLTSSDGNSGSAAADLVVASNLAGFSKSFSPSSISVGSVSTLTFLIDHTAGGSSPFGSFTDNLPAGLEVAFPPNTTTTCTNASITANPGSAQISVFSIPVSTGTSCTISVDVTATSAGDKANVSGIYNSGSGEAGFATALLNVPFERFNKTFTNDPVGPGDTVNLQFTLTNDDRDNAVSGLTFTDDLDAMLSGAAATGLPATDVCGAGSTLTGTSVITLTGGILPAEGSCTFSVTVQIPGGAAAGTYPNSTSSLSSSGGTFAPPATDNLLVIQGVDLTKTFLADPVGTGASVDLEFTLTNADPANAATAINFTDNLAQFLSGTSVSTLPPSGFCGAGSTIFTFDDLGDLTLGVSGASLPAGGSCTFTVTLQLPDGAVQGTHTNTTSVVTATINGQQVQTLPASDDLTVAGAPVFTKDFTDDPATPGGTVTLEFTLDNTQGTDDATAIAFTDDLDATLTGLAATGLPMNDICGAGSQISGTNTLTFTGGTLSAGASCTFSVTLDVPAGATPGAYTNTTSPVTATVLGVPVTGNSASDDLQIPGQTSALVFSKSFTDDPVPAGGTVTLEFTIQNTDPSFVATGLAFQDVLTDALPGLVSTSGTQTNICGTDSQISGTAELVFSLGSVAPSSSCTFSVTLSVPSDAPSETYSNATTPLTGVINGSPVQAPRAEDDLVISEQLAFSKTFTDDPVQPGGTVTLEFTIDNLNAANAVTALSFFDDLNSTLSGLVAVGLPTSNVCGAGSQISGTSFVSLTGGNIPASGSCTFSIMLQVPAGATPGVYPNTTGTLFGTINGVSASAPPATDDLTVAAGLMLEKSFTDDPTVPGSTVTLQFTVTNTNPTTGATDIAFTDNLDATLTGLVATGLPASNICGTGSTLTGTSTLSLSAGTLNQGSFCTFSVTLQVPGGATPGTYPNTTSTVSATVQGATVTGPPATDNLIVANPIGFTKLFTDDPVKAGETVTLTFSVDNPNPTLSVTNIAFTDDLDATLTGLSATGLPMNDVCGAGSQISGTSTLSLTGGSLAPASSCIITVTLQVPAGAASGDYTNTTSTLTADLDGSPITADPASDVLNVANLDFTLADQINGPNRPGTGDEGETITYTTNINNLGPNNIGGAIFSLTPHPLTSLVVGSVSTTQGTVTTGNGGGDTTVEVDLGTLTPPTVNGPTALVPVTITFDVLIGPIPDGTTLISVQAQLTATNISPVLSQDPDGGGATSTPVTNAPLPVELSRFEAFVQDGRVRLNWQTASETDNAGFEVQYRTIAEAEPLAWQVLGFVDGAGTTSEVQSYAYLTEPIGAGRHLFRLKQIDFDGQFEFSPEIEAVLEVVGTHELSAAYPNPFNPQAQFTLALSQAQQVRITLHDVTGREVQVLYAGTLPANEQQRFTVDGRALPSGLYFYRARGEFFEQTRTVLLLK